MLFGIALLSTLAAAAEATPILPLPPSLRPGALEACAPTTLEAAEKCLVKSLSPADLAIVQDRIPARQFRAGLDCEIERAWRLGDPNSPMANVMRGLLGFDHPGMAAGMIISDFQAKAAGASLPWDEMRRDFGGTPPEPPSSTCNVKITPPPRERSDAN